MPVPSTQPPTLCGYEVEQWLKPDRSALCRAGNGKRVVLKLLDEDCLLDGDLHPSIRERLARIRELAHRHVATLIAVEKAPDGRAYGVWEYVGGTDVETWARCPERSTEQVARMLRELILAVETLHGLGLVHGAVHAGNVLIDPAGELRLLDVSPLLWDDPQVDIDAAGELVCRIVELRGEEESDIGAELVREVTNRVPLRELSAAISRTLDGRANLDQVNDEQEHHEELIRRRAFRWAIAATVVTILVTLGASWLVVRHNSAAAPPSAPVEAMKAR